jgi:hypothetical protein
MTKSRALFYSSSPNTPMFTSGMKAKHVKPACRQTGFDEAGLASAKPIGVQLRYGGAGYSATKE